ncbi:putative Thyrotropin-releasing hormone receptor [Hypsibius exemplaris]|uniref:Thyrotropin-releasing hormone receptor n=1 Tax=Hypsibius exemplaris TaxID=2072580 RepID=A0A1W0W9J5_HYPEX|nr:putative Thyrotropin-releasing hormone receptor [Hypsibius exemplaris]
MERSTKSTLYRSSLFSGAEVDEPPRPSSVYRAVAVPSLIFLLLVGLVGNITFVLVVKRSRSLHSATFIYLVSLAFADLIILLSGIPIDIRFSFLGPQWLTGQLGCAAGVFFGFLGLNLSSTSIVAFTIERYIAICHPLLAVRTCTAAYARKVIFYVWLLVALYTTPWLFVVQIHPYPDYTDHEVCRRMLLKGQSGCYVFLIETVLFYVVPLLVSVVVYAKLGRILHRNMRIAKALSKKAAASARRESNGSVTTASSTFSLRTPRKFSGPLTELDEYTRYQSLLQGRLKVFRMLFIIVAYYAISWLPFRGLLVYNCMMKPPFVNDWFMLTAKLLIYSNSAVNPFLYNFMSKRFKKALYQFTTCSRDDDIA